MHPAVTEAHGSISLAFGRLEYVLRRNARSRGLRVTVDARRGVVVSIPPATRRGWSDALARGRIETFLREREAWLGRHVRRLERERAAQRARGGASDGGVVLYRGLPHTIRVLAPAAPALTRSRVERAGAESGDELLIALAPRDARRADGVERVAEAWLRERAREAIDGAVARHAPALGVRPSTIDLRDPRTRWGSASKSGRLMFSWRLVLGPPDTLETVVVHELAHLRVFGHGPRFWALVASRRPNHLADRAWLRRNAATLHSALATVEDLERTG
jgi:predicted metal-dependent hydrolase